MSAATRARRSKKAPTLGGLLLLVCLALAQAYFGGDEHPQAPSLTPVAAGTVPAAAQSQRSHDGAIEAAFRARRSDQQVLAVGRVRASLPDDNDGSRHQRFILELPSGHTVLVAHNIDLAARAPIERGDTVEVHGEYEWNERGGVVHWTHRDPVGRHVGGWLELDGRRYQ